MAFQILLNFLIALTWMFLQNNYSVNTFIIGYLLGLLIIFGIRRFFVRRFYLLNIIAIIKLLFIFIKELILANIEVLKLILAPKLTMQPGIFALETDLKKDWEITMLANLITLTPGTLVVDVSSDGRVLFIHAVDIDDIEKARQDIKNSFEEAIKEVSR